MLLLAVALLVAPPTPDSTPLKPAFRAAAIAVLDSASRWSPATVAHATRLVIDVASFQDKARQAGSQSGDWTDFERSVRAGAENKSFDAVKTCTTMNGRQGCTLPAGLAIVHATEVQVHGAEVTLTILVSWPYRQLMGFAEYKVLVKDGKLVSIKRGAVT